MRPAVATVAGLVCPLLVAAAVPVGPVSAQSTTIRLSPRLVPSAMPGSVLTFEVWLDDPVELGAFQFKVDYPPELLEFESVELGPLLGSTGREVIEFPVQVGDGTFTYGAVSDAGFPGASVSGLLATFRLSVTSEGQAEVRLSQVDIVATDESPMPVETGPPSRVSIHQGIFIPFASQR